MEELARLKEIVDRLRSPGGCPWDREQTPESLKPFLLEEAHEVAEAIESGEAAGLCEELGDLLMNIFLQARIAEEEQRFTLEGVARGISEKLVRRHPHVFGDVDARDSAAVRRKWEAIKREEKEGSGAADIPRGGTLRPLPASMPALQQADRIGRMAAEIGFDWPDPAGPLEKMDEELTELRSEVDREDADGMEREIGDLLFAVTSLARRFEIDPEQALRAALGRFRRRFRRIEAELMASSDLSLATLDRLWERAKREVDGAGSRRRGTAELPPPAGEGR